MKEERSLGRPYVAEEFPLDPTAENLTAHYAGNPSQEKIDRFALLIPVVKDVVARMVTDTPTPNVSASDFWALETQARAGLDQAIRAYMRENEPSDALTILSGRREGNPGLPSLLRKGAKTATGCMNSLLSRLPYIYEYKYGDHAPDAETLVDLAKKNYHLVLKNAGVHSGDLDNQFSIGRESFDTVFSYLELDEDDIASVSPAIHDKFPRQFDASGNLILRQYTTPTVRCPALYSDAIFSLWKWHLTGAERIYTQQIRERGRSVTVFPGVLPMSAD